MKIEAVTISLDYSEWLSKCLANNEKLDRWIIVTHSTDTDTIDLCKQNKIEYKLSDRFFEDGALFAKGKAINDGLTELDLDDWILHIDGDIILPENFREIVEKECIDKKKLYGSIRYDMDGNKMMGQTFAVATIDHNTKKFKKTVKRFDIPIGYFQLWHSTSQTKYIDNSKTGKTDDWKFAMQFKPKVHNKILANYMSGFVMLPLNLHDASGFQGHYKKHWKGLRHITQFKKKP